MEGYENLFRHDPSAQYLESAEELLREFKESTCPDDALEVVTRPGLEGSAHELAVALSKVDDGSGITLFFVAVRLANKVLQTEAHKIGFSVAAANGRIKTAGRRLGVAHILIRRYGN
ncbi:hypothetical protein P3T73_12200 [Kiritimatiellota bacterium B12222]|nr:hypothetical protein P3T73_09835 [Kiritimatiellota bacterium B12222]WFB34921.1 hypothetical protein P3T73_12200 [Kiritimatiellota bacterium B12222]